MKKFQKSKKSREILQLYVEFTQNYLVARTQNDETLLKFLDDVAAATLGELTATDRPERILAIKRLCYVLEKQRAHVAVTAATAQAEKADEPAAE